MIHQPDVSHRLIVALDVPTVEDARRYVDDLDGVVGFYKIGLELFLSVNANFLGELRQRQCRIFLDLKMNDVDETIRRAVAKASNMEVDFLTILGDQATVKAACLGRGSQLLKILGVPFLSSWTENDLRELLLLGPHPEYTPRFQHIDEYVYWRADQAVSQGCDGLIASGEYVKKLRARFKDQIIIVAPAIRPSGEAPHEHARFLTPAEAIRDGADYLVVGRPIRDAPNRKDAALRILDEMEKAGLPSL